MSLATTISEDELLSAVTETLNSRGMLDKLKAKIRSEVLSVLGNQNNELEKAVKPQMNEEVKIMNELIYEYLDWMEYKCTSSMLISESGMTSESISRRKCLKQLNVTENGLSSRMPLLVSILSSFRKRNELSDESDERN